MSVLIIEKIMWFDIRIWGW